MKNIKTVLCLFLLCSIAGYLHTMKASNSYPTGFIDLENCIKKGVSVTFLLQEPASEQFILTLDNGIVVNDGGIITPDGKLLEETIPTLPEELHLQTYRIIPEKQTTFFDGRLAVISSPWQHQWYHWLLQVLPRLKILAESGVEYDKIYINNVIYPWQKHSLAIIMEKLAISPDRLLFTESGDSIIKAKTLIVPSMPYSIFKAHKNILPKFLKQFLQTSFLRDYPVVSSKRIYISRSKATVRRIINEDALIKFLKSRGFEILNLEDLSIYDQARHFYDAELIIGPHGSGFTNLIFSRPNTTLIEIDYYIDHYTGRGCFKDMAKDMKCNHIPFYIHLVHGASDSDDFFVDLDEFRRFCDTLSI